MKTVLIVEDRSEFVRLLEGFFDGEDVNVLHAEDLNSGFELFHKNQDNLDLIIVDACVPGTVPNSMPLVEEIVKCGFKYPVVASSSDSNYSDMLMKAGATHKTKKDMMGQFVLELLGLE